MENYSAIDILWLLVAAILIFMMQPGFAMLETGMTRAKNGFCNRLLSVLADRLSYFF